MVAGEGAKDDGKIKKVSLPLLKNLIFSRTGKGPKAKNNTPPADATEPPRYRPAACRGAAGSQGLPNLPLPTHESRTGPVGGRARSISWIDLVRFGVIVTSTRGAN